MVSAILLKPGIVAVVIMAVMLTVSSGLLKGDATYEPAPAPAPSGKDAVISVVRQLLEVLETGDIEKGKKTVMPGAYLVAVRGPGGWRIAGFVYTVERHRR